MKSDFEKELERRPWRNVPREWRAEILGKALSSGAGFQPARKILAAREDEHGQDARAGRLEACPTTLVWWREMLWPCPQAWAGLAAVWLIILGLRLMAGSEAGAPAQVVSAPASPELRAALDEQRRLFTELLPLPEPPPPVRHQEPAERPRSQRREGRRYVACV